VVFKVLNAVKMILFFWEMTDDIFLLGYDAVLESAYESTRRHKPEEQYHHNSLSDPEVLSSMYVQYVESRFIPFQRVFRNRETALYSHHCMTVISRN
jgi:hypothetical protein